MSDDPTDAVGVLLVRIADGDHDALAALYAETSRDVHRTVNVGWSIDSVQKSTVVVYALDMAIKNRRPEPDGIVHADQGVQGGLSSGSTDLWRRRNCSIQRTLIGCGR